MYIHNGIYKIKMIEKTINNSIQPVKSDKTSKLILSLLFDGIGMLSYVLPIFAEVTDLVWAPISGILLMTIPIVTGKHIDRKSTRLNSSHSAKSRMPSSA